MVDGHFPAHLKVLWSWPWSPSTLATLSSFKLLSKVKSVSGRSSCLERGDVTWKNNIKDKMLLLSRVLWDGRQIRACWECCYLSWRLLRSVPHLLWLAVRSPTRVCFRISHFFPGFWQNYKNGTKRTPQVEGSQSLQIFLFQSLQTQQKCLKGSTFRFENIEWRKIGCKCLSKSIFWWFSPLPDVILDLLILS